MKYDSGNDPLWLNRPWKARLIRVGFYLLLLGLLWIPLGPLALAPWLFFIATFGRGVERLLEPLWEGRRRLVWSHREGRHYSFAGVELRIHDDGRDCWIDEASVRRLLGLQKDPALKARFAHQWRESAELGLKGPGLWIRVEALVRHLAEAPERMDPKRVRLRVYLDREILQPAQRRRQR